MAESSNEFRIDSSKVVITGAGSLGIELAKRIKHVGLVDVSDYSLFKASQEVPHARLYLADISSEKMKNVLRGAEICIHTEARKYVDLGEYNPVEYIETNVLGTFKVASYCVDRSVKIAVLTSSDKATSCKSIYGLTKALAEKIWLRWRTIQRITDFKIVRLPNLLPSRGSIFERKIVKKRKAIRFYIPIQEAAEYILKVLDQKYKLFIPKAFPIASEDLVEKTFGVKETENLKEGEVEIENFFFPWEKPLTRKDDWVIL